MPDVFAAIDKYFGFNKQQSGKFFRASVNLAVWFGMLKAYGWLASLGVAAPFASAADVDDLKRAQAVNARAAEVSARINMQTELRLQTKIWCSATDAEIKASALRKIDELRAEFLEITKTVTPEPTCAKPAELQYTQGQGGQP